ncbi:MAG: hypothetical protein RSB36_07715 [Hydrogenoanaerobacterium sp.]
MQTELMIALCSLAGTLLGTFSGILASNKLTTYRIEQLEKKVDKHNTVIDRTFRLEGDVEVILEKLAVASHRITDLEEEK